MVSALRKHSCGEPEVCTLPSPPLHHIGDDNQVETSNVWFVCFSLLEVCCDLKVLFRCCTGKQNENLAPESTVAALHSHQHHAQSQFFLLPDEHPAPLLPVERVHADAAVSGVVHCQRLLPLHRHVLWISLHPTAAAAAAA